MKQVEKSSIKYKKGGFSSSPIIMLILVMSMVLAVSVMMMAEAAAATYYVDSAAGNDSNNGTSTSTPWKTIAKINATIFAAGDQILLKCGSTWREETLTLQSSGTSTNRITVSSYGTGNKPVISGGRRVTGFTQYLGSIYQANLPLGSEPYLATCNGNMLKRSTDPITEGLLFNSFRWENNKIYVNDPDGNPDITGKVIEAAVMEFGIDNNNGKAYITIDGLRITTTNSAAITINGNKPTYGTWTIQNCDIANAQSSSKDGAGISIVGAKYCLVKNNVISNVCGDGVMLWNSSDCEVTGNNISKILKGVNTGGDGIQSGGSMPTSGSRNKITKNTINVQGQDTGKGCIIQTNGSDCYIAENTCLYGNFGVSMNGSNGIAERNYCAYQGLESGLEWAAGLYSARDADVANMTWRYNVVVDCPQNGINIPTSNMKVSNIKIYNNTVFRCGRGFSCTSPVSGEFKNNIIWNTTGAYVCYTTSIISGESLTSDYNLFDPVTSYKSIKYNGTIYNTFDSYQLATGKDINSVTQDPRFTDPYHNNYRLSSASPAVDRGVNLELTADYENAVVPQGIGVNMGALETTDDTAMLPTPTPTVSPTPTPSPTPTATPTAIPHAAGTIFYVDAEYGNDSNDGISASTAWKTITKVNSVLYLPGDQILFKCGCTWREQTLVLPSSGNSTARILVGAYGTGNKPVISGGRRVTGFTQYLGSIYQVNMSLSEEPYLVTCNGNILKRSTSPITEGLLFSSFRWENNKVYINDPAGNPDVTGKVIEIAVMAYGINANAQNYITVDRLKITTTNSAAVTIDANKPTYGSWTIQNCEITNAQSATKDGAGISIVGAKYCLIKNNVISNVCGDGVMLWNSSDCEVTGNNISRILKGINTGGDGIQSGGSTATSGSRNKITKNIINVQGQDTGKGCIIQTNGTDCYIADNTCLYGNFGVSMDGNNGIAERNYCAYQGLESGLEWAAGLYSARESDVTNMTWRYNVVVDCPQNGINIPNSSLKVSNAKIYNNTVFHCGKGFSCSSPISGEFKNNIIWNTTGANVYNIASIISGEGLVTNYNVLDPISSGRSIKFNGVTYNTLADYQTATSNDPNSITQDPLFTDPNQNNFHLKSNSPAVDTGIDVSLTTDYENAVVPQGNGVNMGAYETVTVPSGLIAYDGFDYPAGTVNGQGGATNGWSASWVAGNASKASVVTGSLSYTGITTTGNRLGLKLSCNRALAVAQGSTNSGSIWFSALACNNDPNRNLSLILTKQGASKITLQQPINGIWTLNGVNTNKGSYNQLALILLKIDFNTTGRTVSAWINPNLASGEAGLGTADAIWSGTELFTLDAVNLAVGSGSTMNADIDEIRLGKNFMDVMEGTVVQ